MDRTINVILKPLRRFAIQKPNASLLLFAATIIAMVLANSPWAHKYHLLLAFPIDLQAGQFNFFAHHGETMSMLAFVNDALMAVFFFVIGLEIKQEVLIGELSSVRKALLPIIAACGGMIVPVLFYMLVCNTPPEVNGAAIPMATDIAFALAVLGLLGKRVPLSMRIFLTALAVVDDIGGIIIIALFYSGHIAFEPLLISLIVLALLYVGGKFRVHNRLFFYIGGFIVWLLFLESGIHPTIAGVLIAFTVPARPVVKLDDFTCDMTGYLNMLDYTEVRQSRKAEVLTPTQIQVLNNIHTLADKTISPLQTIADKLHPLVNYGQQYASQRATLDEHERTFILSAKHLKEVGHGPPPHFQNLLCPPPAQGVTFLRQRHGDERNDDILRCRIHGLAADAEPLAGKLPHGPAYKRPHHDRGLARTDSTVADNGVILGVGKGEDFLLLFRNHASLSNSSAISRRL